MSIKLTNKKIISPEKAVRILAEYGTKVTKEEAELILGFMYKFTILAINQIVIENKIK